MSTRIGAAQAISLPGDEPEAALPDARRGLRPGGNCPRRARLVLRRSRDRRGDEARGHGPAPRPIRLVPAAQPGEPPRLPPLRPTDRPGRQRLPLLRAKARSPLAARYG